MTEETRKLFNAPWKAEEYKHGKGAFVVRNNGGYLVAENMSKQDAQRLARLPELYEALASVMYEGCNNCLTAHRSDIDPTFDFFMDHGCPLDHGDCPLGKHWTTLRKVRDVEGVPETNQD